MIEHITKRLATARRRNCSTGCSAIRGDFTSGWPNTAFIKGVAAR